MQVIEVNALSAIDFKFYFWLFLRRLPQFLMVAATVAVIGAIASFLRPTNYEAAAKILVETAQIPADLAKSTVPTGAAEQFQIIQEDVLSRDNVLSLATRFGLYADRPNMSPVEIFDDMQKRLTIAAAPVDNGGGSSATVIRIAFRASKPEVAANLVNDLVTMILNKDVQLRTTRATDTMTFFNQETERLDGLLRELDGKLLAFKNDHINSMPDSIDFRRNLQTTQQTRLLVLAQEEATLRKQLTDLQTRPFDVGATVPVTPEEQNLQSLRQSLAQQQGLFAENSPAITALRARIATLQEQITGTTGGADKPLNTRDFQIADINDRLAAIADERKSIDQTLVDLEASIAATPGNETVLNSLNRDHQNIQAQYDSAVARLAEASTGQQIELLLKGERLSLIESAIPPTTAQGLGLKMLLAATGILAVVAGLVAVILPELINRKIRRPEELVSRLQILPYITIPYVEPVEPVPSRAPAVRTGEAPKAQRTSTRGYTTGLKDFVSHARSGFPSSLFRNQP